jgi:two-component system alkaline phosphatase synthesis response regulator PhoP
VNNLVKRSLKGEDLKEFNSYKIGDKTIHFNSFELVNADGSITALTKKETMLLKLLIERRNDAVSREQILETVWNYDVYPSTRTIDNFILTFRKYFEPDPKNPVISLPIISINVQ